MLCRSLLSLCLLDLSHCSFLYHYVQTITWLCPRSCGVLSQWSSPWGISTVNHLAALFYSISTAGLALGPDGPRLWSPNDKGVPRRRLLSREEQIEKTRINVYFLHMMGERTKPCQTHHGKAFYDPFWQLHPTEFMLSLRSRPIQSRFLIWTNCVPKLRQRKRYKSLGFPFVRLWIIWQYPWRCLATWAHFLVQNCWHCN